MGRVGFFFCLTKAFVDEIFEVDGWPAWIVGDVLPTEKAEGFASMADALAIVEV